MQTTQQAPLDDRPRLALTMGDVAGIGPEVIARAVCDDRLHECCQPVVVGHPRILQQAAELAGVDCPVYSVASLDDRPAVADGIVCWNLSDDETANVPSGAIDPRAGRSAYNYLAAATRAALDNRVDGLVTAPLHKEALHRAGLKYPGHTEILAELCGVERFAMMLYLPPGETVESPHGLGVAHVTLHTALRDVPALLTQESIRERIDLLGDFLHRLGASRPRIGVCALNPHAGEGGLFGDEEERIIAPAVASASGGNLRVAGPFPADTLLQRAVGGEFDGVVAMYHDQGHIALKLLGFQQAVNVTLGLPIVRTSPSHGTAFDIAWQGKARSDGLIEAARAAARLGRTTLGKPG